MADQSKAEKEIKVSIPMLPDMELAVSRLASTLAESIDLDTDKIDEIKMALIEACLNSFEHSKSKDQMVHVRFRVKPRELEITVKDYGVGFDPEGVEEADINHAIHSPDKRGWGFKIMRTLMDDVIVSSHPGGTQIKMIKRRD
ncbi:MAG TPA: ATP-binding protein [Acidobacteriota bacterium]|nr:ATP-binding protein [Acidobacteriota bacterium]